MHSCTFLSNLTVPIILTAGAVWDIKYSGDRLVTCGEDGTIRIWDSWTGHCVRSITAHQRAVLSISLRQAPGL